MHPQDQCPPPAPVKGAIRNPANGNHFMVVQTCEQPVTIQINAALVAETSSALRVIEIGNKAYVPRLYIPETDIREQLSKLKKTTHCPLKGDAHYYALDGAEVAWRYETFAFADVLQGHLCFDAPNLRITEGV